MTKGIVHEMVRDFKACCVEKGRSLNRDEYCAPKGCGRFSKEQINHQFGSWLEFTQAAGAQAHHNARGKKERHPLQSSINKYEWEKKIQAKFNEELKPYGNFHRNKASTTKTILAGSDFHDEFCDSFARHVFLDSAKRLQPDVICLDGDLVDFPEISSFKKDPSKLNNMQGQIDWAIQLFKDLRKAAPKAEIDFVLGNHELRLFKYLCAYPGLVGVRNLQFDKLFEVAEHGVNIVCRKSFLMEKPKKAMNYHIYDDALVAFHGSSCSKYHAHVLLGKFGMSGFSGHVHNRQYASSKDLKGEKFWVSLPTMANYALAEEYIEDLANWNSGFSLFHIDRKRAVEEPVVLNDGFGVVAGKFYNRD